MRIHAICIALNEEPFVQELLKSLYDFCSGISVITQFDRDYYGKRVTPDRTVEKVLTFPDPKGKIHLIARRYNDETASRNHEMLSILANPIRKIIPHGMPIEVIREFHQPPDYFLIVDADEIYDINTIGDIFNYLELKKPRGMRVSAYQYKFTWNQRIPLNVIHHRHFGFVKAGILFEQRRVVTWHEHRINSYARKIGINRPIGSNIFGFIDCPMEIGMFHHGSYLGGEEKLRSKFLKHSHQENNSESYIEKIKALPYDLIPMEALPLNIRNGNWPKDFYSKSNIGNGL